MDETGHKVQGKKKLDQGFLWTLFGDKNEVAVVHTPTRGHKDVIELVGKGYKGTSSVTVRRGSERDIVKPSVHG